MFFKRLLSVALSLALIGGAMPAATSHVAYTTDKSEINTASYSETYVDGVYYAVYYDHAEVLDYDSSISEVIISDKVNGVPVTAVTDLEYGKNKYRQITSLELPESINTINGKYFRHLSSLQSISVSPTNPYMSSLDGVLFSKDRKELICFPQSSQMTEYTIPDTVTKIGDYAFYDTYFEKLTIPDQIKYIGGSAFWGCSIANGFKLPKSLEKIGSESLSMFIDSFIIPEGLRYLGGIRFGEKNPQEIVFYSPNCYIEKPLSINPDVKIKGYDGSTAYEYANANGYTFESLGTIPPQLKNTLQKEGPVTYIIYSDHAELLQCEKEYKGDIVIPETVDDVPVTEIHSSAFESCSGVKSVNIPATVAEIGPCAFEFCGSITEITIPSGVTKINYCTFMGCSKLTAVTMPDSVERIGDLAFSQCYSLKGIDIPDSVRYIGGYAFANCENLASITIPDSVVSFEAGVFDETPWLKNEQGKDPLVTVNGFLIDGKMASGAVEIPDSVTRISSNAFDENESIISVFVPSSVWQIGNSAFANCTALETITFLNSKCRIGLGENEFFISRTICNSSMNDSAEYTGIIKGYKGSTAEEYANKYGRTFVALDDDIETSTITTTTATTTSATSNTTTTTTTTISTYSTTISTSTATTDYTEFTDGYLQYYIYDDHAELVKCDTEATGDLVVPSEVNGVPVTKIWNGAFINSGIKTLFIPANVTEIKKNWDDLQTIITDCKELEIIKVDESNPVFHSEDGILYDKDTLICCPAKKSGSVYVSGSTYRIGVNAFAGCFRLTGINLGSVELIEPAAFFGCYGLDDITIPSTVKEIRINAFAECNLISINFKNPECKIDPDQGKFSKYTQTVIYGDSGSTAAQFANLYGLLFNTSPVVEKKLHKVSRKLNGTYYSGDGFYATVVVPEYSIDKNLKNYYDIDSIVYTVEDTDSNELMKGTSKLQKDDKTQNRYVYLDITFEGIPDNSELTFNVQSYHSNILMNPTIEKHNTTTTTTTTTATTTTTSTTTTTTSTAAETTSTAVSTTTTAVFEHGKDTWGFTNSATNFRKSGKLVLLESEKKRINELKALYNKHTMNAIIDEFINNPGGACYGMSLFDLVYMSDREKILPLVQEGAQDLHSIALTDEVRSMINYYSILQVVPEIQYEITTPENGNDDDKIEKLLTLLEDGPVLVCYQVRSDKNGKVYSHAVVAYDVEAYTPTESDSDDFLKSLNYTPGSDTMKVIKVYDPQYSKYSDNCNIYINTSKIAGKDVTLWSIKESYKYNDLTSKYIMLVSNNLDLLNKYGLFKDIASSKPDLEKKLQPKLTVTSMETDNGPLDWLLNINYENYKWIEGGAEDDHPYYVSSDFYGENPVNTNKFLLKYPYEGYSFDYEGESSTNTKMRTQYPDSIFDLEADKLKSASFYEDRMSFILDGKSLFKFSGISDKQSEETDFYTVTIEGTASGKVECLYDGKGTWWITSEYPLKNINISASNDKGNYTLQEYSATSRFITIKYSKQQDKISIGNEDDTSYVPENEFGDINDDSMIDAKDASMILIAYSKASTGDSDGLSHEQRSAADVNSDGKIDAKDASVILAYYSLVSTSGDNAQTLSEFVGSKEK